jgi:polynucleotide 5'-kinase involved in rRNA processing
MNVVYDAGVLVAADRDDRDTWVDHRIRLELGIVPTTTAPVVAQVSRTARQVQLRRFLRGCEIEAFSPNQAHDVGTLIGQADTSDVVDAHLIVVAAKTASTVLTSDLGDLGKLSNHLSPPVPLRPI